MFSNRTGSHVPPAVTAAIPARPPLRYTISQLAIQTGMSGVFAALGGDTVALMPTQVNYCNKEFKR